MASTSRFWNKKGFFGLIDRSVGYMLKQLQLSDGSLSVSIDSDSSSFAPRQLAVDRNLELAAFQQNTLSVHLKWIDNKKQPS